MEALPDELLLMIIFLYGYNSAVVHVSRRLRAIVLRHAGVELSLFGDVYGTMFGQSRVDYGPVAGLQALEGMLPRFSYEVRCAILGKECVPPQLCLGAGTADRIIATGNDEFCVVRGEKETVFTHQGHISARRGTWDLAIPRSPPMRRIYWSEDKLYIHHDTTKCTVDDKMFRFDGRAVYYANSLGDHIFFMTHGPKGYCLEHWCHGHWTYYRVKRAPTHMQLSWTHLYYFYMRRGKLYVLIFRYHDLNYSALE